MPFAPPVHRPVGYRAPDVVKREYDQARAGQNSKDYDRHWQKVRDRVRANTPLCAHCLLEGVIKVGEQVDHITPVRIAPDRRLDITNCQNLCIKHHALKSAQDKARQ